MVVIANQFGNNFARQAVQGARNRLSSETKFISCRCYFSPSLNYLLRKIQISFGARLRNAPFTARLRSKDF